MTDYRVVFTVMLIVGVAVYGGLTGAQFALGSGQDGPETTATEPLVRGTTIHLDRSGRPTVVGEVVNGFDTSITNVTVTVTFYRNGTQIGQVTQAALRETVEAGDRAPFDVHMRSSGEADRYEVALSYDRGGEVVPGLTVENASVAREAQSQVDVVGEITNTRGEPLVVDRVVATFYNANGSVIGARTVRPSRTIQPDGSYSVRIEFRTLGDVPSLAQEFARFEISIVAARA
jgi:hypothetical protein